MHETFPLALKHVLTYEGGYVDHPLDPGGATNMGITHKTLSRFRGETVGKIDVRNLSIDEASEIYLHYYWHPCHCDDLPVGIDFSVFDCAVNQGAGRATRLLQASVHTTVDGIIGPETLSAIDQTPTLDLLNEFIAHRMNHYGRLSKLFRTFGLGWSRRLTDVHAQSLNLIIFNAETHHDINH